MARYLNGFQSATVDLRRGPARRVAGCAARERRARAELDDLLGARIPAALSVAIGTESGWPGRIDVTTGFDLGLQAFWRPFLCRRTRWCLVLEPAGDATTARDAARRSRSVTGGQAARYKALRTAFVVHGQFVGAASRDQARSGGSVGLRAASCLMTASTARGPTTTSRSCHPVWVGECPRGQATLSPRRM